jgi:choline dehydrogenase
MGSLDDSTAVVLPNLAIKGLKGARIVDASIIPNVISGHTNSVVVMIGEKASAIIKSEWL